MNQSQTRAGYSSSVDCSRAIDGQGVNGDDQLPKEIPTKAPLWMEIGVTGGLGLAVYVGPIVYSAVRKSANIWWPRVSKSAKTMMARIHRRLEPMNRRRRNGSIIRVIADLLPNYCFGPTPRIFIAGISSSSGGSNRPLFGSPGALLVGSPSHDSNNADQFPLAGPEGMIVAFELDEVESESTEIVEDIDDDDTSCNPEGWEAFPLFRPGAHSTRMKCSTPTPNLPDLCTQNNFFNDSMSTEANDCDDHDSKTQDEIASLKQMIQAMMQTITTLSHNLTTRQNHTDSIHAESFRGDVGDHLPLPPPPSPFAVYESPMPLAPPPPTFAQVVAKSNTCAPGPPPPPPPPMPAMLFQGSAPIKITKSKRTVEAQEVAPSMMDVLKDLNKVKLKSILRSPGGTPVKEQKIVTETEKSGFNNSNFLTFALRKRFDAMHTPPGSDDDSADKENEFDDSMDKTVNDSPRGRKINRMSGTLKPRKIFVDKKSSKKSNELPPFGPHLLKKRNQN